jgi:hypothetical protein
MPVAERQQMLVDRRRLELLQVVQSRYTGEGAKKAFSDSFKSAATNLAKYPDDDDTLRNDLKSPRSMYLRETEKAKLLPLPLVLRRLDAATG